MNPGSDENNFNSSSSRRVSFAATAHVRLFEKDSENFKDSQKLKEMENEINLIYNPEKIIADDEQKEDFLFSTAQTPTKDANNSISQNSFDINLSTGSIQNTESPLVQATPPKKLVSMSGTPTTSFLFGTTSAASTPAHLRLSFGSALNKALNGTPKSAMKSAATPTKLPLPSTPRSAIKSTPSKSGLFSGTPKQTPKSAFGLSSVKASATPLLDKAILSAKKSNALLDEIINQDRSPMPSTHLNDESLILSPIVNSAANVSFGVPSVTNADNEQDLVEEQSAHEISMNIDTESSKADQFESIALDQDNSFAAPLNSFSIYDKSVAEKSEFMELDESTVLKQSPMADVSLTPRQVPYTEGYPRLSPAILQDKESAAPSSPGSARKSALHSPVIQAGLTRLAHGKYRDSIAPFFIKNGTYTPKSVSSLRFSSHVESPNSAAASPLPSKSEGNSPSIQVTMKNSRDSVAPFFSRSHLRESIAPPPEEVASPQAVASPVVAPVAGRDSIAPFFNQTSLDNESTHSSPQQQPKVPTPRKVRASSGVRDSIAPFFSAAPQEESIIETPDQSALLDDPNETSIMLDLEDSKQMVESQGDESLLEGAEADESSIVLQQEDSFEVNQEMISDLIAPKPKVRDSVAGFFGRPSLYDANSISEGDQSFQSNATDESAQIGQEMDVSVDLTETKKGNPFWQAGSTSKDSSIVVEQENEEANESADMIVADVSGAVMSTPQAVKTASLDIEGLSPVVGEAPSQSSNKRRSARKSVSAKKAKVTESESASSSTQSSPSRMTRSQSKKVPTPTKPTPKKSTAVTPMRRQVAQKALLNALASPSTRSVAGDILPSSVKKSPASTRRKSVGGRVLQALKQASEAENSEDQVKSEVAPSAEPEAPLSPVVDSQQAEVNLEQVTEENLMDEQHLSIMDTSVVVHEEEEDLSLSQESPPILDLADFMAATGISFGEFASLSEEVDQLKTVPAIEVAIEALEEEHFNQGCLELKKIIANLQEECQGSERGISENVPLLFDEYSQGSKRERNEILHQLKLTKDICLEQAKLEWYHWKGLTLDHLYSRLEQDFYQLKAHHELLTPMLSRFETLGEQARDYFDNLSKMTPLARNELDAKMNHIQNTSALLIEEKEAKSLKMDEIRSKIQDLKLKTSQLQESTIEAEKKNAEYTAKISNAEKTCAELVVFDPADLSSLRGRYSVLTTTHAWKPKTLSPGKQTWVFDDAICVSFTNQGDSFLLESSLYQQDYKDNSIIKSEQFNQSSVEIISKIGASKIVNLLKVFDKSHAFVQNRQDIKSVMMDISIMWESVKTLYRDIEKARHFTSSAIEWVDVPSGQSDLFQLKTKFFNASKRIHIEAHFSISTKNGLVLYPNGKWNFDFKTNYGTVSESLRSDVLQLSNGPDLVARCCRLVQELIDI